MVVTALLAGVTLAPLELKVDSVSLFKNGYAVVVRQAPIARSGTYTFDEFPSSVLGTMWLKGSDGIRFREVTSTTEDTTTEASAQSLDEVLTANVGKPLVIYLSDGKFHMGTLEGVTGSILVFRTDTEMFAMNKASVARVSAQGDNRLIWKSERKGSKRVVRVVAEAAKPGILSVVSLERGTTWAPAYSIDISNPKDLQLVARATILNDTLNVSNCEIRLITGFPNVPFLNYWDPFTVYQSVDQFVGSLMRMGTPDELRKEAGAAKLAQNAAFRDAGFDEAFSMPGAQGFAAEDLFFYPLKNISLKKGDRGYFMLFSLQSPYTHIYKWDVPDRILNDRYQQAEQALGDVWHSLSFRNTTDMPLTTAPVTVFKDGEVLGQDMLMYTSARAETLVRMTKALDVRAEDVEEEVSRDRVENQIRGGYYDLVTLKGTLDVQNRKAEEIKLSIRKELTGEVITADGSPKITSIVRGLRAVNPRQQLSWEISLKKGERRAVTYTYKVYVAR